MSYERGDIVEAGDPFNPDVESRPFVISNTEAHPFDGEQYIGITLTTRTWYEETIRVPAEAYLDGELPRESYLVPWGVVSIGHADIETRFGRIDAALIDEAVDQLTSYLE